MLREWPLCPKTSNLPDASEESELKFKPTNGPYQGQHLHRRGNFIVHGTFFLFPSENLTGDASCLFFFSLSYFHLHESESPAPSHSWSRYCYPDFLRLATATGASWPFLHADMRHFRIQYFSPAYNYVGKFSILEPGMGLALFSSYRPPKSGKLSLLPVLLSEPAWSSPAFSSCSTLIFLPWTVANFTLISTVLCFPNSISPT